jgi:hypothetical protein
MFRLRAFLSVTLLASAIALVPGTLRAQGDAKIIDLTGKWLFNVTTDAGSGTPTVTFKQKGDSLTGHYSSQTLGEADLKGTVTDRKISFTFRVELQGTPLIVTYTGTIDSNDAMRGKMDIGGSATGTFTAKRQ